MVQTYFLNIHVKIHNTKAMYLCPCLFSCHTLWYLKKVFDLFKQTINLYCSAQMSKWMYCWTLLHCRIGKLCISQHNWLWNFKVLVSAIYSSVQLNKCETDPYFLQNFQRFSFPCFVRFVNWTLNVKLFLFWFL